MGRIRKNNKNGYQYDICRGGNQVHGARGGSEAFQCIASYVILIFNI